MRRTVGRVSYLDEWLARGRITTDNAESLGLAELRDYLLQKLTTPTIRQPN